MDILSKFAENLSDLIFDSGIDACTLGKAIDISAATVCRWKKGEMNISLSSLLKLANYFNCSLEFLAGRTETPIDYTPKDCPPFYERLRAVMRERGKTRYRLVKDTEMYDGYFTNWKNGADPHILTLVQLADYLGCTIDYLVGRE